MRYPVSILIFILCFCTTSAQTLEDGTIVDIKTGLTTRIKYDVARNPDVANNTYETTYNIYGAKKEILYTAKLRHLQDSQLNILSIKAYGMTSIFLIPYDKQQGGLVITVGKSKISDSDSDVHNNEMDIDFSRPYFYIVSYSDTERTYPALHRFSTEDNNYIEVTPLSQFTLDMHRESIRNSAAAIEQRRKAKIEEERKAEEKRINDSTNAVIAAMRVRFVCDSLSNDTVMRISLALAEASLSKYKSDSGIVSRFRTDITEKLAESEKNNLMPEEFKKGEKYAGEKVHRRKEGKGLLLTEGKCLYDGYFKDDTFEIGNAIIKSEFYELAAEMSERTLNGKGQKIYANGDMELGNFQEGAFQNGIVRKTNNGNCYFGRVDASGIKSGYGVLYLNNGEVGEGEFRLGHLYYGYRRDHDWQYHRIIHGTDQICDVKAYNTFNTQLNIIKHNNNLRQTPEADVTIRQEKPAGLPAPPVPSPAAPAPIIPSIPVSSVAPSDPILQAAYAFFKKYQGDSIAIGLQEKEINQKLKERALNKGVDEDVDDSKHFYLDPRAANTIRQNGIMVDNTTARNPKIYEGVFIKKTFITGHVYFKNLDGESYIGEYSNDFFNGTGQKNYKNGDFFMGEWKDGKLSQGISRIHYADGYLFFGQMKYSQRNGFGTYAAIDKSKTIIGIFENDMLKDGYGVEVDNLGVSSYFKVEHSDKTPIEPHDWAKFSGEFETLKKGYVK